MSKNDVKVNAGELRCFLLEINEKIDFVLVKMNDYNKVLKKVQTMGIKDHLIRSRIAVVANEMRHNRIKLCLVKEELNRVIEQYNSGIRDIDRESFADFVKMELATVETLLGRIL